MRPLNSKERRVKFLLFVLLFVLSTLPLLLLVYQYGKLDVAENRYLRERYDECRSDQRSKDEDRRKVVELAARVRKVRDYLKDKNPSMMDFDQDYSGTIESDIREVKSDEVPYRDYADSTLLKLIEDMSGSLILMNRVYEKGYILKKDYTTLNDLHNKCQITPTW